MAMAAKTPYQYLPITGPDGIRLIVLRPAPDKAAPVQCSIIHTTLRHAQEEIYEHYTALSYVWGNANDTTFISIDGQHHLQVTKNLECALRYLRDGKRVLRVWADGVCINQQDDDEKGKQVQQMGRVYEIAHHTVIFLGECDEASEAVLTKMLSCYQKRVLYPNPDEGINALKQILGHPWFYRIWILQELVMSHDPKVQFGQIRFPWRILSFLKTLFLDDMAQENIGHLPGPSVLYLKGAFEVVSQMNNAKWNFERAKVDSGFGIEDKQKEHGFDKLLSILEARRGFQGSDPRDRVFAHVGLVHDLELRVDYGITHQKLFQIVAERHISEKNSYDIFGHIEDVDLQQRQKGLPSWVPDWSFRLERPRYRRVKRSFEYYGGTEDQSSKIRDAFSCDGMDFQNGTFTSRGYLIGEIRELGQVLDTTSYELSSDVVEWLSSESGFDIRISAHGHDHCQQSFELAAEFIRFIAYELELLPETGGCFLDGRRLIRVDQGWAVVPASSQIGDLVYFLRGSSIPLVFRDTLGPAVKYDFVGKGCRDVHLIGECIFVPGPVALRQWGYLKLVMELIMSENSRIVHDITIH